MAADAGPTALDVVKLAVDALTPIAVVAIGYLITRRLRRVEQVQWANQTVVTRRLQIFDKIAPKLNQLLCFGTFVGRWKEITPANAITLKRELDEIMYANRVLFSDELFAAYQAFMRTLYSMYANTDGDALLRTPINTRLGDRRNLTWWADSMTACFDTSQPVTSDEIYAAYDALGQRFRADLYVTHTGDPLLISRPEAGAPD